jgi:hypothetical protein
VSNTAGRRALEVRDTFVQIQDEGAYLVSSSPVNKQKSVVSRLGQKMEVMRALDDETQGRAGWQIFHGILISVFKSHF